MFIFFSYLIKSVGFAMAKRAKTKNGLQITVISQEPENLSVF